MKMSLSVPGEMDGNAPWVRFPSSKDGGDFVEDEVKELRVFRWAASPFVSTSVPPKTNIMSEVLALEFASIDLPPWPRKTRDGKYNGVFDLGLPFSPLSNAAEAICQVWNPIVS